MRHVTETDGEYARMITMHGIVRKQLRGGFPDDVFVWPEDVKTHGDNAP